MQKTTKILYLGPDLPYPLTQSKKIKLEAVAYLDDFEDIQAQNPVDRFFKLSYFALTQKQYKKADKFNSLFQKFKFLASQHCKSNCAYLDYLVKHQIKVLKVTSPTLEKEVKEAGINLFLVNGWAMLPMEVINIPELGCINIHPSKLPRHRGALPLLWALKEEDTSTAITYMTLDKTMDGGQILRQFDFPISDNDNPITLEQKAFEVINRTMVQTLEDYVEGKMEPQIQNHKMASKTARNAQYKEIFFTTERARDIAHKVIHYNHYEPENGCFFRLKKYKIKVKGCEVINNIPDLHPGGAILSFPFIYVKCKDHSLKMHLFKDFNLGTMGRLVKEFLPKRKITIRPQISFSK